MFTTVMENESKIETSVSYVLKLSCPNRAGIVAAVSGMMFEQGFNILDSQQYDDTESDRFFARIVFDAVEGKGDVTGFRNAFERLGRDFKMDWTMTCAEVPKKVIILVSKFDHCLADLLYRHRTGELPMEIVGIISNHPRQTFEHLHLNGTPFHHLPVSKETKSEQETEVRKIIDNSGAELVILARYMQILSDELSTYLSGQCINIHHSFLPSFKGARPYHQAHSRGVKIIGATAHYVTPDLDEGPIIAQDVEHISHRDSADDLVRKGRDIERRVLARAVRHHLEDRILINGSKTVVFPE